MTDSKVCANPDCAAVFHRNGRGRAEWARRKFCSLACTHVARRRGVIPPATHCRGKDQHPMTPDNVYTSVRADGTVGRRCRACNLAYDTARGHRTGTARPRPAVKPTPTPAAAPTAAAVVWRPPGWAPQPNTGRRAS